MSLKLSFYHDASSAEFKHQLPECNIIKHKLDAYLMAVTQLLKIQSFFLLIGIVKCKKDDLYKIITYSKIINTFVQTKKLNQSNKRQRQTHNLLSFSIFVHMRNIEYTILRFNF